MIIEAKEIDGVVECKHEINIQCSNCNMTVDAVEYAQGTCSDCGAPWDEIRHTAIHVTSIPMTGQST
jgi:hypothetical protein